MYHIQTLYSYLNMVSVSNDQSCKDIIQYQINNITATLEMEYDLQLTLQSISISDRDSMDVSSDGDTKDNDDYFGFDEITPDEHINYNEIDIEPDDIDRIADIFDEKLDDVLSTYHTEMTEEELTEFCPNLDQMYQNIAKVQRRLLIGMDPTLSEAENEGIIMEKNNFCSYTNRIKTDDTKSNI